MGIEPIEFSFLLKETSAKERALLGFSWFSIFDFSVSIYDTIFNYTIDRYKRISIWYSDNYAQGYLIRKRKNTVD